MNLSNYNIFYKYLFLCTSVYDISNTLGGISLDTVVLEMAVDTFVQVTKRRGGWGKALSGTVYATLREVDEAAVGTNCIEASNSWNHCKKSKSGFFNAK